MGLPKPAKDNIQLSDEDLKKTQDMEKLTTDIEKLIEKQENEVTNFYKHFSSFELWVKQNLGDVQKFRTMMIDKLQYLKQHVGKTLSILQNILYMTKSEEKLDSKKIMIKDEIAKDFSAEEDFAKELNYPREVIKLTEHITRDLDKELEEARTDLKVENKTEELLKNMVKMMEQIAKRLDDFETFALGKDLSLAEKSIHMLVEDIQREKAAFDRLSNFEKLHLHLLLDLYEEEKDTLAKESMYADHEEKYKDTSGSL